LAAQVVHCCFIGQASAAFMRFATNKAGKVLFVWL